MKEYRPVYPDHYQSPTYRLDRYTVDEDGRLIAHFADGTARPSVYANERELLDAVWNDWRERVRLVEPDRQATPPRQGNDETAHYR